MSFLVCSMKMQIIMVDFRNPDLNWKVFQQARVDQIFYDSTSQGNNRLLRFEVDTPCWLRYPPVKQADLARIYTAPLLMLAALISCCSHQVLASV